MLGSIERSIKAQYESIKAQYESIKAQYEQTAALTQSVKEYQEKLDAFYEKLDHMVRRHPVRRRPRSTSSPLGLSLSHDVRIIKD